MPAEWEEQDGVIIALPHQITDWRDYLKESIVVFYEIISEIAKREKAIVIKAEEHGNFLDFLPNNGNIIALELDVNDTWARDFGPIVVYKDSKPFAYNFGFNGWGLKFASNLDNQINNELHKLNVFSKECKYKTKDIILEGGSIDSNGAGLILTTAQCLLESNRNPHLNREDIEKKLCGYFGAEKLLWLEHGALLGDDTDSHIDTLARFVSEDTIVYKKCYDHHDYHYSELQKMEQELKHLRDTEGKPFRLVPLPMTDPIFYENERLPSSYANFLIINDAVLVPTYNDINDKKVLSIFKELFPHREIVGIDCSMLIRQHGSLHCVTMQLPKGTLRI